LTAALFPGQGSQELGMGRALYEGSAAAREILGRSEAVLPGLLERMWNGPEEDLRLTQNQQPSLLAVGVAAFAAYRELGGTDPQLAAGHSLGEWTAHVAAGTLGLEDAILLVHKRGLYMQRAVPVGEGAMAAVLKLPAQTVVETLQGMPGVEVANFNSPEQTVISGSAPGVAEASEALKALRARVVPLPVSAPFHSSLMAPAAQWLAQDLQAISFANPRFPVYSNVLAQPVTDGQRVRELLLEQIYRPVRWVEILQDMRAAGVTQMLEFGVGKVLTGLVGRTIEGVEARSLTTPDELAQWLGQGG
jgi:[acyl-carrier-protein] S-malonyltransferase